MNQTVLFCLSAGLLLVLASAVEAGAAGRYRLARTLDDPDPTDAFVLFDGDGFGGSLDSSSGLVIVGAPRAKSDFARPGQTHVFDADTGALLHTLRDPTVTQANFAGLSEYFGSAVAIDGTTALIGSPGHNVGLWNDVGEAHLFNAATGQLIRTIPSPDGGGQVGLIARFGAAVAMQGNRLVIAAPYRSSLVGSEVGRAYLYTDNGTLLQTFDNPNETPLGRFGSAVAIDGDHVLVGAPATNPNSDGPGEAHLFRATTGELIRSFEDPTPTDRDFFGFSVAIDGDYLLIGASRDDTVDRNVGQVHVYSTSTGELLRTLDDPTRGARDFDGFGESLAIEGELAFVGAPYDSTSEFTNGQAHLFNLATGQLLQTFDDPTPTTSDRFGIGVAIDGDLLVVGAEQDDTLAENVGQAHLYLLVPEPTAGTLAVVAICLAMRRRR